MERDRKIFEINGKILITGEDFQGVSDIVLDIDKYIVEIKKNYICIAQIGDDSIEEKKHSAQINGYLFDVEENRLCIEYEEKKTFITNLEEINSKENFFEGFPYYKRSPRVVFNEVQKKYEIRKPPQKKSIKKQDIIQGIIPPIATVLMTVLIGLFLKRGAFIMISAGTCLVTTVFSIKRFVDMSKENKIYNMNRTQKYRDYLVELQRTIADDRNKEKEALNYRNPSVKDVSDMLNSYSSRMYERTPYDADFMEITLGYTNRKSGIYVSCNIDELDMSEDELIDTAKEINRKYKKESVVPLVVNLKNAHLGIVGERTNIVEQIKIIVSQLIFFQSYHDMQVVLVCDDADRSKYDYMRWYPHLTIQSIRIKAIVSDEQMMAQVMGSIKQVLKDRNTRIEEEKKGNIFLPHLLFVIDSAKLISNHAIMEYLQKSGCELGFSIIYTTDKQENLPENIKTICVLENSNEATLVLNEGERVNTTFSLMNSRGIDFEHDARKLGKVIHEQGVSSNVPESISFFDMYGITSPSELKAEKRWKENQSSKSLAVPLGLRAKDDVVMLDIHEKAHGPHGLVAGTTGSGKSEILQTYILSLAVNFHPNEVGFLLIDYKGGGMANLFAELPHLVGTITNIDKLESTRALASIKSELARRQKVFGENGVNHINGYNMLFREGKVQEPLPHLFIISDEFAELKKEQPDFMTELVSAARIGRSLGVHLILATQKPSGVVDDQIWTNSRFKLCLKVQDAADSREMLHTTDAADIVNPGRTYLQVGNNEIYELFQSAWSGERFDSQRANIDDVNEDNRVYLINKLGQGEIINRDLSDSTYDLKQESKITELEATIKYIKEVYNNQKDRIIEVKKPWLPSLKNKIVNPHIGCVSNNSNITDMTVAIGVIDIPEEQAQPELMIDFTKTGNCMFIASSGYGKSVFLSNIIISLAEKNDIKHLNMYILDFGSNALISFAELPHCCAHIMLDDKEKFTKFCAIIEEQMRLRKRLFATEMVQNIEMYNSIVEKQLESILIVVDNYDAVKELGYDIEDLFTRISREGISLGIYVVVTASRLNAIKMAAQNNYKVRIAGFNFDESESRNIVGRSDYHIQDIKGRGLIKYNDRVSVMQMYSPVEHATGIGYVDEIKRCVENIKEKENNQRAKQIPILPEEYSYAELSSYDVNENCDIFVGLEAQTVEKVGIDFTSSPMIVFGDSGSGKTNMLGVLLLQLLGKDITLVESRNRSLSRFKNECRYLCLKDEIIDWVKELEHAIEERENIINNNVSLGMEYEEALNAVERKFIIIDDLSNLISVMGTDMDRIATIILKSCAVGFFVVVSESTNGLKSIDSLSRELKTTKNAILLSEQGFVTLFPIKASQSPKKPDGILMKKGEMVKIRIPLAENELKRISEEV